MQKVAPQHLIWFVCPLEMKYHSNVFYRKVISTNIIVLANTIFIYKKENSLDVMAFLPFGRKVQTFFLFPF